jgi:hypothetical protein
MEERRLAARHKTFIRGRIFFNNRLSSVDCIIRDLGTDGGRLEVSEGVTIPTVFDLYIPNRDEEFHARVEWRKGNYLGASWNAHQTPDQPGSDARIAERLGKLEHEVAELQRRLDALQST